MAKHLYPALLALCTMFGAHTATAQQNLSRTNAPPVAGALKLTKNQISQLNYEDYMQCAGQFEGGYDVLRRTYAQYTPQMKQKLDQQLAAGAPIVKSLADLRHDLPIMAPHLDQNAGELAYGYGRFLFDDKSRASVNEQMQVYNSFSRLSNQCMSLIQNLIGLQSLYYSAQKAAASP